jgi:hypothetical protein
MSFLRFEPTRVALGQARRDFEQHGTMPVELGGRTSKRKAMADNVHVTNYLPLSAILLF